MTAVPRLRDDVRIRRTDDGQFAVSDREGAELFRLTVGGFALLRFMDGVTDRAAVLASSGLDPEDLDGWIASLDEAGVLVDDSRAVRALRYLAEQGIAFRRASPDRRGDDRDDDDGRRDPASSVAPWWNYAVVLLNDGMLEEAVDVLDRMADSLPGDARVPEAARHLKFVLASEANPALAQDRRDVGWDAFDAALRDVLEDGTCPRCNQRFEVELGANNRCWSCGASFSGWILDHAVDEDRRNG
ncbi:MAG: hypothetical protein GY898_16875 [Proteobacteria bacterium]|nr:hypothetical protein [Pseudomonadota bacterium]